MEKRKGQLEGVCVSGGEPCLHSDLADFLRKIKTLGFQLKLDTNGSNPEILTKLFKEKLVDFVAMDIKGPLALYEKFIGSAEINKEKIKKSIKLIKEKTLKYEFRSTLVPYYHDEKMIQSMGELIQGAKLWVLQNFQNRGNLLLDPEFQKYPSFPPSKLQKFQQIAEKYVDECQVRN